MPYTSSRTKTKMTNVPQFDGQRFLDSFREFNSCATEVTQYVDDDQTHSFLEASTKFSANAADAAHEAETALTALNNGNPVPAERYLDRMTHIFGMMSLATQIN